MKIILLLLPYLALSTIHPEGNLNFVKYCKYFNYPVEEHVIQTEDGYLLTYFRVQAKGTKMVSGKKVVLLQHGLLDSSDTFIINDEDKAPAFLIANKGYDVWLGNNRGNKHGRAHVKKNPFFWSFWDFTQKDFAIYDLPAGFKYIVNKTGQKIQYIGHSQGTAQMHIHLSLFKQSIVRDNLIQFIGMGPVAWVTTKYSPLVRLLDTNFLEVLATFGLHEFMPGDSFLTSEIGRVVCGLMENLCGDLIGSFVSADPVLDNYDRYDVLAGHSPAGTSVKNLKHWQQFTRTGEFKRYDYGDKENLKKYGSKKAPLYDLSNIDVKIFYIAGYDDLLAAPKDVNHLFSALVNAPNKELKFYDAGHCSFMWGRQLPYLEDLWAHLE
ncbi:unnamed protein product (macronuclear) [Paramecium tetraurelia]|uniref:Lipase n=1 Tax=Paramecium tetraurelia TaxID=5888 RepID=A0CQ13_PARTE|nr:uncharacterized protein GSPATT00038837001 [Paramecium tetraurelia]CAK72880.1 unnamed protein product [Paramecium tetraurelia]|eukprot:XP_001440277.1 hypothetical protein (macronuclear) [Paramecium tetraurelia strain d4-2]